jgi:hypothetical protein
MAVARLCYGAITLLIYLPLARQLVKSRKTYSSIPAAKPLCEEA